MNKIILFFYSLTFINYYVLQASEIVFPNLNTKLLQNNNYSFEDMPRNDRERARLAAKDWQKECIQVNHTVGYPTDATFFPEENRNVVNQRVSLYLQGAYSIQHITHPTPSMISIFPKVKGDHRPGDYFIIEPPIANLTWITIPKKSYFGQKEETFGYIYALKKLYDRGVSSVHLEAHCYGGLRATNMMYYLSKNEQSRDVENFFLKAEIDRIQKEKLLAMLATICMQTPLKNASDGPISLFHSLYPIRMCSTAFKSFNNYCMKSEQPILHIAGLTFALVPHLFAPCEEYIVRNIIMPRISAYDSSEKTELQKLQACEYFKQDYPEIAAFITTAKEDRFVGNWGIEIFFNNLPINDKNKYLIPSSKFGHGRVGMRDFITRMAFLKQYKSSYLNLRSNLLQKGNQHLDFAQKGQQKNLAEYIEYMESDDNYPYSE